MPEHFIVQSLPKRLIPRIRMRCIDPEYRGKHKKMRRAAQTFKKQMSNAGGSADFYGSEREFIREKPLMQSARVLVLACNPPTATWKGRVAQQLFRGEQTGNEGAVTRDHANAVYIIKASKVALSEPLGLRGLKLTLLPENQHQQPTLSSSGEADLEESINALTHMLNHYEPKTIGEIYHFAASVCHHHNETYPDAPLNFLPYNCSDYTASLRHLINEFARQRAERLAIFSAFTT